jgi:[ribosomal protein S18]-alanine N-acetyltransferase
MFLYELAVDEPARRQGIGRALVEALARLARERGCYGMFVLTDDDNVAALATYRSAGAGDESRHVMLEWELRPEASTTYARRGRSV